MDRFEHFFMKIEIDEVEKVEILDFPGLSRFFNPHHEPNSVYVTDAETDAECNAETDAEPGITPIQKAKDLPIPRCSRPRAQP